MHNLKNFFPTDWRSVLPFLKWIGDIRKPGVLRADIIAGVTVALVLVPQSMAYAQLAGLPAYYGLYASFLPGIIAAAVRLFTSVSHRSGCRGLPDDGCGTGADCWC